ncbi:hypothetical protein Tco_0713133 [Tanacetum coccineum]
MDIKKQWATHGIDADMEYDPSDVEFTEWLALKFYNHKTIYQYTKNVLWIYWTRGKDEVELTDEEFSNLDNKNLIDKDEIDINLLTSDILRFKTYDEFKNEWMDEWNKGIPWVPEEPWPENEIPIDDIHHICEPFRFKNGKDGKLMEEALKKKAIYERSWGNATQGVLNFCAWLNGCFRNFHELSYELLVKLKEYWWKMNDHECSPFYNWKNHINGAYVNTNIDANYNPYLDVSRTFNNHEGWNDEKDILKEMEPNDDHGIGNLNNDLVRDNASYHANNKEYKENRCELLGNPRQELSVCEIRRFEIIKYSFGPAEKNLAIKECEYDDLTKIKDDACHAY